MKFVHQFSVGESKFALRKLTRSEKERAHIFNAAKISECLREGILSKQLLIREYEKQGGVFTKEEIELQKSQYTKVSKLNVQIANLENKKRPTQADKKTLSTLKEELSKVLEEVQTFENERSTIFENTAESIAKNYTILWCLVKMFVQFKEVGEDQGEYVSVFDKETFEDNLDYYEELEDEPSEINSGLQRAKVFVSFWFSNQNIGESDFAALEEYFEKDNSWTG